MKNIPAPRRHATSSGPFKTPGVPLFSTPEPATPYRAAKRPPRPATTGLFQAPEATGYHPEEAEEDTREPCSQARPPRPARI
ncbi:hypothetical protein PV350_40575 [Streptomyces sp. PA03-6a]|nr:hypothetical protein [Streptomyces sp. PA03-6a]